MKYIKKAPIGHYSSGTKKNYKIPRWNSCLQITGLSFGEFFGLLFHIIPARVIANPGSKKYIYIDKKIDKLRAKSCSSDLQFFFLLLLEFPFLGNNALV